MEAASFYGVYVNKDTADSLTRSFYVGARPTTRKLLLKHQEILASKPSKEN
jgi:hypothetical protein